MSRRILFLALRFSLAAAAPAGALSCASSALAVVADGVRRRRSGRRLSVLRLRCCKPWACVTPPHPRPAFLTGLTSVMVPLLAALVYRIRPQVSEVVGVLVATAGLALMTLEGVIGSISRGDLLTFLLRHGVRRAHRDTGPLRPSDELRTVVDRPDCRRRRAGACPLLVGGTAPCRVAPARGLRHTDNRPFSHRLAFTVQAWAQQYTTSTRTALIYMLEPVVAWMTSYFLGVRACPGAPPRARRSSWEGY